MVQVRSAKQFTWPKDWCDMQKRLWALQKCDCWECEKSAGFFAEARVPPHAMVLCPVPDKPDEVLPPLFYLDNNALCMKVVERGAYG